MHYNGKTPSQGHVRLTRPAPPRDFERPGFEPIGGFAARHHDVGGFVERRADHGVTPREEICDLPGGMIGDTCEDASQICFGIEAVELGGLDQRQFASGALAAPV